MNMNPSLTLEDKEGNAPDDDCAMLLPSASSPAVDDDSETSNVAQLFSKDPAIIAQETQAKFPIGKIYEERDLINEAKQFAENNYFRLRIAGRNRLKCSRSENVNSKRKKEGNFVMQKAETALACDCPYEIKFSVKKSMYPKVTLSEVNPLHNHECQRAQAAVHVPKVRAKRKVEEIADLRIENEKLSGENKDLRDEINRLNEKLQAVKDIICWGEMAKTKGLYR